MKRLLATVLTLFVISDANAFETGQELFLAALPHGHEFRAYVSGIMERHMLSATLYESPQAACPAPETTRQEMADKVFKVLAGIAEMNPDNLKLPARTLVFLILGKAYPCQ